MSQPDFPHRALERNGSSNTKRLSHFRNNPAKNNLDSSRPIRSPLL
jgi:hypothetical protein